MLGFVDYCPLGPGVWCTAWRAMTTQHSSLGPNQLILQRAKLVTSWEDVIEELPTPIRTELLPVEAAN